MESVEPHPVPALNDGSGFTIRPSAPSGTGRTLIPPDTATCDACLTELADPADRRHRHPFITCTHCGPRFTVVTGLPYDRPRTTMAGFPMCQDCAREYAAPADRRFHAQPIACPACGPRLTLRRGPEDPGALHGDEALAEARRLLAAGAVVAVKGIGGYHLACDAGDPAAVRTLRKRKNRGGKPFAVLADSLVTVRRLARVDEAERDLLTGPRKPVVLLRRHASPSADVAPGVAPGSPDLGVMLPYTPLHRLLLGLPGDPPGPPVLVMTSGNRSGEPIVTDDAEALARLDTLADAWLQHDRPIHVPCDDSVVRICAGAELPVRRSRGYAPLPLALPLPVLPALAVGGDLKNTFCAADDRYAWLSAHVGDMDDLATLTAFAKATAHLTGLTTVTPSLLIADRHPGYRSTQWARRTAEARGLPSARSSTTTPMSPPPWPSTASTAPPPSSASPSTAPGTATTGRSGAARCSSRTTTVSGASPTSVTYPCRAGTRPSATRTGWRSPTCAPPECRGRTDCRAPPSPRPANGVSWPASWSAG